MGGSRPVLRHEQTGLDVEFASYEDPATNGEKDHFDSGKLTPCYEAIRSADFIGS